ncbi:MAG: PaaI family thioesterase [Actinomycetota bacterium]
MEKMGLEWLRADPQQVVARIPVEGNTQPQGLLHGGASAVLAESIASVGAWLADPTKVVLGVELKVNHIRSGKDGFITGVGTPLHTGSLLAVWQVRMTDDRDRLTAFSTCTVAFREPR